MHPSTRRRLRRRSRRITWSLSTLLATALGSALAHAGPTPPKLPGGDRKFGLGGGIGDPFGPSMKLFLHPAHALQFDLGWAPLHFGHGVTHVNYLFHFPSFVSNEVMDFGMYLGGGLGVGFWGRAGWCDDRGRRDDYSRARCGYYRRYDRYGRGGAAMLIRVPVGVFFHFQQAPVDVGVEGGWSPYVVRWYPWLGDFSVKCRYYF
jgi:hypothetical protein